MFGQPNLLPGGGADSVEDKDMRKRARYLRRCQDVLWSRWTGEYIKILRERHNLNHTKVGPPIEQGDVVLIQSDERNRGKWNIGVVVKLIKGRDRDRPRSEIEGREILPGTSSSTVVSYGEL